MLKRYYYNKRYIETYNERYKVIRNERYIDT